MLCGPLLACLVCGRFAGSDLPVVVVALSSFAVDLSATPET